LAGDILAQKVARKGATIVAVFAQYDEGAINEAAVGHEGGRHTTGTLAGDILAEKVGEDGDATIRAASVQHDQPSANCDLESNSTADLHRQMVEVPSKHHCAKGVSQMDKSCP
jgi:hypothetical protein